MQSPAHFLRGLALLLCLALAGAGQPPARAQQAAEKFDLSRALRAGDYGALEKQLNKIRADKSRDAFNRRPIYKIYEWDDCAPDLEARMEAWRLAFPSSFCAFYFSGQFYRRYAWSIRGHSWNGKMSPTQKMLYVNRSALAERYFDKARELDPNDPAPYGGLIDILKKMGEDDEAAIRPLFEQGVRCDPDYYPVYSRYMGHLSPYWGGEIGDFLKFVDECANTSRTHSMVPYAYVEAHFALVNTEPDEMRKPEVWAKTQQVFDTLLKNEADPKLLNQYALFAWENDKQKAAKLFERIQADWEPEDWNTLNVYLKTWSSVDPAKQTPDQLAVKLYDKLKKESGKTPWRQATQGLLGIRLHRPQSETTPALAGAFLPLDDWQKQDMVWRVLPNDVAISCTDQLIAQKPSQTEAMIACAELLCHGDLVKRLPRRADYLRRAFAIDPDPETLLNLCDVLSQYGQNQEIIDLVDKNQRFTPRELMRISPEEIPGWIKWGRLKLHVDLLRQRANAKVHSGQYDSAIDDFKALTHIYEVLLAAPPTPDEDKIYIFARDYITLADCLLKPQSPNYDPREAADVLRRSKKTSEKSEDYHFVEDELNSKLAKLTGGANTEKPGARPSPIPARIRFKAH